MRARCGLHDGMGSSCILQAAYQARAADPAAARRQPGAVPAQSIPAQTIPAQTIPAQTIPAQSIPAQSIPAPRRPRRRRPAC